MWYLIFKTGLNFPLLVNKVYNIGRKGTDIVINDDSSVSRKHGTIKIIKNNNEFNVVLTDTSKFGTYHAKNISLESSSNAKFTKVDKSVHLINGDLIRIGAQHTVCKLVLKPLVVVTSRMEPENLVSLQKSVSNLGGTQVNSWNSNATHLSISKIILNIKVTQALASACWIVKESFFDDLHNAVDLKAELPLEKDYLPPIDEENLDVSLISFLPNSSRKSLFEQFVFVFFTKKQLKRLGLTCSAAGATIKLINDFDNDRLCQYFQSTKTIFIQENISVLPPALQQQYTELQQKLEAQNLRFIQEHEIGLALLYCSTDAYVNPSCNLTMENMFTQHSYSNKNLSEAGLEESQQSKLFISKVPETELFDEKLPTSSFAFKKRSHEAVDLAYTDCSSESAPTKTIKLDEFNITEKVNFLSNIGSSKNEVKPPPKRKAVPEFTDSKKPPKRFCNEVINKEACFNSKESCEDEILQNIKEELPDSCIADDSLWSNKADSQEQLPKVVDIKSEKPDELINMNQVKVSSSCFNAKVNSNSSGQDNVVLKKAFIPSSVPDDEISSDLSKFDPDLPFSGLSIIVHVPLVKKKPCDHKPKPPLPSKSPTVRNFKKFVKVLPSYKTSGLNTNLSIHSDVPRIIGGKDLISHVNKIDKVAEMLDDFVARKNNNSVNESNSDDDNPFA